MSAEAAIIYGLCAIGLALLAGASAGVGPQQPSGISPSAFRLQWRRRPNMAANMSRAIVALRWFWAVLIGGCITGAMVFQLLSWVCPAATSSARSGAQLALSEMKSLIPVPPGPAEPAEQIATAPNATESSNPEVYAPAPAALGLPSTTEQADPRAAKSRADARPSGHHLAELRPARGRVGCNTRSCVGPIADRRLRSSGFERASPVPYPTLPPQPAVLTPNGGEIIVQALSSLPPGFEVGMPAYAYAQSVQRSTERASVRRPQPVAPYRPKRG